MIDFLKKKIPVFGFAGILYLLGEYLRGDWFVGTKMDFLCHPYIENGKLYCHSLYLDTGLVLIAAGEIFAIVGIILLLANERGLRAWWRVSRWFVPIATLLAIVLPVTFSLPVTGYISREAVVWLLGYLYILTTLLIVLGTRYAARKKPPSAP